MARPRLRVPAIPYFSPWTGLFIGLVSFAAWHALITGLAPPTDWDALAYHLTLPKLYLSSGRIEELPWLLHSHWPHLLELLYAVPLTAAMDNAAAVLHGLICAGLVLALWRSTRQELGPRAAGIATILFVAQPVSLRLYGAAHSDGGVAFFHFLACLALWSWRKQPAPGRLAMAGILSGCAAACKLLGLIPAAGLGLWVFLEARRRGRGLSSATLYGACVLALVLPWYVKTWMGAGNPFWPFASSWLGGRWEVQAVAASLKRITLFSWPLDLTLLFRYHPQFLLIPAAAAAAWAWWNKSSWPPFVKFLFFPALPYFAAVAAHHEAWRFLFPLFPALAALSGWGLAQAWGRVGKLRWVAAALILTGISPLLAASQNNQLFVVLGLRSSRHMAPPREIYLNRSLDHHRFFGRAEGVLPPGSRLLLFREIRGYYLNADYLWGDPNIQGVIAYARLADPEALRKRLEELGVTHILINEALGMYAPGFGYYDRRTLDLMDGVLARWSRPLLREDGLALYALTRAGLLGPSVARQESANPSKGY
ncbi:MAG TPA: hypothetical protein DCP85_02985 [Elusimicrobia bacterium]|nr:hypothetical protein [Elusimicrobiota bacterium]